MTQWLEYLERIVLNVSVRDEDKYHELLYLHMNNYNQMVFLVLEWIEERNSSLNTNLTV